MSDWDQDTIPDGSNTEPPARQPETRSRASSRGIMATVGAVVLVALAVATFGYLSQNGSGSHRPASLGQTATATPTLLPTATPTPLPTPSPTVAPTPTATPIPVILAVSPTNYANVSTDCAIGSGYRTCTFMLTNQSSTTSLSWTATATVPSGADETRYLQPASGVISPGGSATASFTASGEVGNCNGGQTVTLRFNGPDNTAVATINC